MSQYRLFLTQCTIQSLINFRAGRWATGDLRDSTHFRGPNLWNDYRRPIVSIRDGGPNQTKFCEDIEP